MSYGNDGLGAGEPQTARPQTAGSGESHTLDTAKQEAADMKDTATSAAKDVAGTAKDEAASVAQETKAQVTDLYHQARHEFTDQASKQQERIATGLSALGDELGSMARNSEGSGVAGDLVQKVSERVSGAASWLSSRDPSAVLTDVKAFARRRPGAFIGGALVAGVLVGRLTRALATNAKEQSEADAWAPASGTPALPSNVTVVPPPPVIETTPTYAETPRYSESESRMGGTAQGGTSLSGTGQGVSGERSDSV